MFRFTISSNRAATEYFMSRRSRLKIVTNQVLNLCEWRHHSSLHNDVNLPKIQEVNNLGLWHLLHSRCSTSKLKHCHKKWTLWFHWIWIGKTGNQQPETEANRWFVEFLWTNYTALLDHCGKRATRTYCVLLCCISVSTISLFSAMR